MWTLPQEEANMDLDKLVKVMGYTASPNDGEVLNAIRIANGILNSANITWEQFIAQKTIIVQEVMNTAQASAQVKTGNNPEIEKMLVACLHNIRSGSGLKFVQSLADWYKAKGFLTQKQKDALERWYDNI